MSAMGSDVDESGTGGSTPSGVGQVGAGHGGIQEHIPVGPALVRGNTRTGGRSGIQEPPRSGPRAAGRASLLVRRGGTSWPETDGKAGDADVRRIVSAVHRRTLQEVDDREPEPDQSPR